MFFRSLSRRGFLKTSLAGIVMHFAASEGLTGFCHDEGRPVGHLSLYNTHNGERLSATFRDAMGNYDRDALNSLNWILRCHYTNEATAMDAKILEFLNRTDNMLGGDNEIHIISGYRSPCYNNLLRSKGRGGGRKSLHLSGRAIDVAIPGHNLDKIKRAAQGLRLGGVGYYPAAGFVHLDSGAFRTW